MNGCSNAKMMFIFCKFKFYVEDEEVVILFSANEGLERQARKREVSNAEHTFPVCEQLRTER